jgi:hypothetical protein
LAKIKFYLDEHIPKAVAAGLLQRNIGAVSCVDVGMSGKSDEVHLTWALGNGYVVVTQDNDFLVLHSQGHPHAGIAFAAQPRSIGEFIRALLLIHEVLTPDDMSNYIEFI